MKVMGAAPSGGLIVIGGPPFGGRGALAALLAEWLPRSLKLETVEELSRETFPPNVPTPAVGARASAAAVAAAIKRIQVAGPKRIVIVAGRFERPQTRRLAYESARESGVPFLYVEARSSNIRAIRRMFPLLHARTNPARKLELYERALERYVALDARERARLPSVALRAVLSDLDAACASVLSTWNART